MTRATNLVAPLPRSVATYALVPLNETEVERWDDLIAAYDSRELFHGQAWLAYLAASRGITIGRWSIRSAQAPVGYLCGGFLTMGPFRIFGSPLQSWGTNVMGPLMNRDFDQTAFLQALDAFALEQRLAMIEIEHPMLLEGLFEAAGFEPTRQRTYLVPLSPGRPTVMWDALDSTCRNRVRKALRHGLSVEDTDNPGVIDEYYDQYLVLLARKNVIPPFPREHARLLFAYLKRDDQLFALRVKDPSGHVLAVGLFPHDDHAMYFWSSASRPEAHALCPNDLLHWRAMCLAAEQGLVRYNTSGDGRFKSKFGGGLTTVTRWHKCYSRSARLGRAAYDVWFQRTHRLPERWLRRQDTAPPDAASPNRNADPFWVGPRRGREPRPRRIRLSDIWTAPLHDFPIRDAIIDQYFPVRSEMHVLEVGPGSGITAFRLARRVKHLVLLDVAKGNLERLKAGLRSPNLSFVCADVCGPDLPEAIAERFDAIYALEVFELLPDPQVCLQNLSALLRPGGRLLLQFPNYPPLRSPGPTHYRSRNDLDRALRRAGFESWEVYALHLRPYAARLYRELHERPIRLYRLRREPMPSKKALVYDESWAFRRGWRLQPLRYALNAAWMALATAMRLGGPVFAHSALEHGDILNRNLVVLAKR